MTDVVSPTQSSATQTTGGAWQAATPRSLYLHIPFCASKCFYCDFTSYVAGADARERYVRALLMEIRQLRDTYFGASTKPMLDTVFVGGGTPTMLSAGQWTQISEVLHECFVLAPHYEWTSEANPGTVDRELLGHLHALGVNRISFGAQTFNETLLQAIGRLHSADDVRRSVEVAHAVGFRRINLDLMIGLPDQTAADVEDALTQVKQAGVTHVSAYGLKVEAGTPFAKWQAAGHLALPDEEDEADMYEHLRDVLAARGFEHYEISNFAMPGQQARHNLTYWRNQPYLAAGAGAHGYVHGHRYENERNLLDYEKAIGLAGRPVADMATVSSGEAMEDSLMLALRLKEGLAREQFAKWHGQQLDVVFGHVIRPLNDRGWLADDGKRIWIPPAYYPVANEIFASFIDVLP